MHRRRVFLALSSWLPALPMAAEAELAVQQANVRIPVAVPAVGASPAQTAEHEGHRFFDLPANMEQWLPQVREFLVQQIPPAAAALQKVT